MFDSILVFYSVLLQSAFVVVAVVVAVILGMFLNSNTKERK